MQGQMNLDEMVPYNSKEVSINNHLLHLSIYLSNTQTNPLLLFIYRPFVSSAMKSLS